MKLSKHAFERFWDVHAWAGVVGALLLTVMFYAGAFALFHTELGAWLEAPLPATAASFDPVNDSVTAIAGPWMHGSDVDPSRVDVYFPDARDSRLRVGYVSRATKRWTTLVLDGSGSARAERSRLASVIFDLHYLWHDAAPWMEYVAGLLSVLMLVALVTGVLVHWKDLVRQLVQFRPYLRPRFLWSDVHKVAGLFGLPFQAIYAYTGALLALSSWLVAPFIGPVFATEDAANAAIYGTPDPTGIVAEAPPGEAPSLEGLLARAVAVAPPGFALSRVVLEHEGEPAATARFDFQGHDPKAFPSDTAHYVTLRARDGALVASDGDATHSPARRALDALYAVHFASFGGLPLRALFALSCIGTCFTLLTGNWIWLLRREARAERFGNRLLARATVAVGVGTPIAFAAAFWINRLVPASYEGGAKLEELGLFAAWALALVVCLARANVRGTWAGGLALAGALHVLLPVLGWATGRTRWPASALSLGVEATLTAWGAVLLLGAWKLWPAPAAPVEAVDG